MQLFFTKGKNCDGLLSKEACNLPTSRSKAHPQKISQLRMNFHTSCKCCLTLWNCFHEILHSSQTKIQFAISWKTEAIVEGTNEYLSPKKFLPESWRKEKIEFLCPKLQKNVIPFDMTDSRNFSADETLSLIHFFPNKMAIDLVEKIIDTFQPTLVSTFNVTRKIGKWQVLRRRRCLCFEISQ